MREHNPLHDEETQSEPTRIGAIGSPAKWLEDGYQPVGGDRLAEVVDATNDPVAAIFEQDLDRRLLRTVSNGIVDEVSEHLQHAVRIEKARTFPTPIDGDSPVGMHDAHGFDRLLNERMEMRTERVTAGKQATQTSSRTEFFLSLTLVMILYMSIIMHGIAVMRSVLEEKTSRIVEVLLASVTPKELMAGKIIGVGAVGLTQLALWYAAGFVFVGPGLLAARSMMGPIQVPMMAIAMFPVFYVLAFFLYATLWAMLGAMSNSEQEAQQMQFFVMMPLILSTMVMVPALTNPNSPIAVGFSLFPFSTPLVMYARIAAQGAPMWQVALSIVLMLAAIYVVLLVAARIYRVGILMYGKRPTLPELIKWFKYA